MRVKRGQKVEDLHKLSGWSGRSRRIGELDEFLERAFCDREADTPFMSLTSVMSATKSIAWRLVGRGLWKYLGQGWPQGDFLAVGR